MTQWREQFAVDGSAIFILGEAAQSWLDFMGAEALPPFVWMAAYVLLSGQSFIRRVSQ